MENILTISSFTPPAQKKDVQDKILNTNEVVNIESSSNKSLKDKYLQPDQVEISEASRQKLSEEEKDQEHSFDISNNRITKYEAEVTKGANDSDIDKEIRELSMEILELTIKIEMLKAKEDKESIKEVQTLEVELAMKKGVLEATVARKLQMATDAANMP